MRSILMAGALALALPGCALALEMADIVALDGVWVLAEDDPRRSGDQAEVFAAYALTLNFGLGGGYAAEGVSPVYGWSAMKGVSKAGTAVVFSLPAPEGDGVIKITALGAEKATVERAGETMTLERIHRGEMPPPPVWFEAVALRLTQGSDQPQRFVAMTNAGEDPATACADTTRLSVEFDLLSPISRSVMVKQDIDITGYGINEIDFDAAAGIATIKVSQIVQDPPPEETWTIAGLNAAGPISVSPMGTTFADCTGPVR